MCTQVYEMAGVKQNNARADVLEEWHRDGGIMIIGYEMLRNLSQGSRCRNKKQKAIFQKTLIDPGKSVFLLLCQIWCGALGFWGVGGGKKWKVHNGIKIELGIKRGCFGWSHVFSFCFDYVCAGLCL